MKFFKYLTVGAAFSLALTGCSDFLEPENKSNGGQDADTYFSNDPAQLQGTAYNALYNFAINIDMHDLASDIYWSPRAADDGEFARFIVDAENSTVLSYYKNAYNLVKYANCLAQYADAGSQLEAEGIFLRNYAYYLLTQQFGGVPYFTHYVQDAERDYPRATLEEMYPAMLDELTAIYNSSALPDTDHTGKASKQAVAALAAEIALAYAWDCGTTATDAQLIQGKYDVTNKQLFSDAAAWAEKAINGVQLTMSFADKWSPFNEGNVEEIFSIQYSRENASTLGGVESAGHNLYRYYTCYYGNCNTTGLKPTSGGGQQANEKAMTMWERGDERFEGTFMTTLYNSQLVDGTATWGTQGYFAAFNCGEAELAELPIAYKIFPAYYTDDEVYAWLDAHKSQTKSFSSSDGWCNLNTWALRLDYPVASVWAFKADGSYEYDESRSTSAFYESAMANGTTVKKWDDPEQSMQVSTNDYRDIVKYHVSQMYLTAAEAYLLAGEPSKSLEKINAVRKRAGLGTLASFASYEAPYSVASSFQETELDLILDEFARECYAEQHRYFELRRTKQLVRYNVAYARSIDSPDDMRGPDGNFKLLRPIPQSCFDNNTALSTADQNPGYSVAASASTTEE